MTILACQTTHCRPCSATLTHSTTAHNFVAPMGGVLVTLGLQGSDHQEHVATALGR